MASARCAELSFVKSKLKYKKMIKGGSHFIDQIKVPERVNVKIGGQVGQTESVTKSPINSDPKLFTNLK